MTELTQGEFNCLYMDRILVYAKKEVLKMVKLSHTKVRAKMMERNLKQEPFAEILGISVRHVRSICYKDMDVAVSLCYRLSQALQTPMESLLIIREEEE